MGRIEYGEYGDPVANLWQATAKRALGGKRGQAALMEIRDALLAMPSRRLMKDEWAAGGEVCALGAVDVHRHMRNGMSWESARLIVEHTVEEKPWQFDESFEVEETAQLRLGYTRTLVWEVMEKNDEQFENMSPEQRWGSMLRWVEEKIK